MSLNRPLRSLSASASMHLQNRHPVHSFTSLCRSLSLLYCSPPSQCRGVRHLTSTPPPVVAERSTVHNPHERKSRVEASQKDEKQAPNPEQLQMDIQKRAEAAAARARARFAEEDGVRPSLGSLADNSLFADERHAQTLEGLGQSATQSRDSIPALTPTALELRNPSHLAAALNPRPKARAMWQRRMVIRSVRQRGRLSKTLKIARAERSSLSRSHFFKTSMKKLAPLTRQIAGKPIDEAILQMRFSKKKVAREVREHLIEAKHEAIVARGMGLGHLEPDAQEQAQQQSGPANKLASTSTQLSTNNPPRQIQVSEPVRPNPRYLPGTTIPANPAHRAPTDIYISQAWINRGPYEKTMECRARGRANVLRPPNTGFSVLLKEEKTRAREAADKETKRIRRRMGKNMWTQLPDRKITRQGQYLLW